MNKNSLIFLITFLMCFNGNVFGVRSKRNQDDDDFVIDLTQYNDRLFGNPVKNSEKSFIEEDNPEEKGPYLEGDLLVPLDGRNGIKPESYRWKNGEIPFEIRGDFTAHNMDTIERAMIEYHKKTCIKFIPRRPSDKDYISIQSEPTGCWSSIGRIGGKQNVNLQTPTCLRKIGTVLHELKHAVGFLHEQNREDRDNFVKIISRNIKPGTESNFNKAKSGTINTFGVKYDYGSVMHYSTTSFSKDGKPTIEAKQKTSATIGQRDGFSKLDIQKINKMYRCDGGSATTTSTKKPSQSALGNLLGLFQT